MADLLRLGFGDFCLALSNSSRPPGPILLLRAFLVGFGGDDVFVGDTLRRNRLGDMFSLSTRSAILSFVMVVVDRLKLTAVPCSKDMESNIRDHVNVDVVCVDSIPVAD